MFKGIGQLAGLMGNLPRIREEMDKLQQRLPQLTAEGDAGAGMVKVRVNGRLEVIAMPPERGGDEDAATARCWKTSSRRPRTRPSPRCAS